MRVLLNVGCGLTRPHGWINTDSSLNALLQTLPLGRTVATRLVRSTRYDSSNVKYMDLNRPWKFASGSVDVVYASHVFEHLTLRTTNLFLNEALRVLRPGGVIRIVVPDLLALSKQYVTAREAGDDKASEQFLHKINLHLENSEPESGSLRKLVHFWQGYPHQHKYMYDAVTVERRLRDAGFVDVRTDTYGRSEYIPEIADVECTAEGVAAVYLEARKP